MPASAPLVPPRVGAAAPAGDGTAEVGAGAGAGAEADVVIGHCLVGEPVCGLVFRRFSQRI